MMFGATTAQQVTVHHRLGKVTIISAMTQHFLTARLHTTGTEMLFLEDEVTKKKHYFPETPMHIELDTTTLYDNVIVELWQGKDSSGLCIVDRDPKIGGAWLIEAPHDGKFRDLARGLAHGDVSVWGNPDLRYLNDRQGLTFCARYRYSSDSIEYARHQGELVAGVAARAFIGTL